MSVFLTEEITDFFELLALTAVLDCFLCQYINLTRYPIDIPQDKQLFATQFRWALS